VTIAAGILCTDGMVLCADTEHTITEDRKAQASKMRVWQMVYPLDDDETDIRLTIGFAGAGYADWVAAFIQGIDSDVLDDVPDGFDIEMFETLLKKYAEAFFDKYIRAYAENPSHRPQAHMVILTQFSDKRRDIFRVHENLVLRTEENSFVAVGAGAPVFQTLAKSLLGEIPAYKTVWTMKEAASIAVYIMDRVKSEVPGCGGNSHIVMIGRDGEQHEIPTKTIKELEIHHAEVEAEMYGKLALEIVKTLP
jgi:20S proteasome alpha/beta subunit